MISLRADQVAALSSGTAVAVNNNDCAEPDLKFAYWTGKETGYASTLKGPRSQAAIYC